MQKLQGKRRSKKRLYAKIFTFSAVILVVILIKPTWNIWQKYITSRSEVKSGNEELRELKERQAYLEAEIKRLQTQSGLEIEVVKKFDLVREGEELAVIIEPEEILVEEEVEVGFIQKFFKKYFGWLSGDESKVQDL